MRHTKGKKRVCWEDQVKQPVDVVSESARFASRRDDFRVFVSSRWYFACWCTITIFRGCEIAFLTSMTWLYRWMLADASVQSNTVNKLRFGMSYSVLRAMNWAFVFVSFLQFTMLLRSIYYSLKARTPTFRDPSREKSRLLTSALLPWNRKAGKRLRYWTEQVFHIHGKYFDTYFTIHEHLEVCSQIYQGYQMSLYIATRWINNVFVIMIVINCVSTPIIHLFVPSTNVSLRRLLDLICSALLSFTNSVVIPLIIFIPYVNTFDSRISSFPNLYLVNDVWYARAARENQQVFITSYLDFWTTWLPHWSLFSVLFTCEDLLRRSRDGTIPATRPNAIIPATETKTSSTNRRPGQERKPPASKAKLQSHSAISKPKGFIQYNMLWVTGITLLAIHIAAQSPPEISGCQLPSTPWFASKSSCVIMHVNCYRRKIDGRASQVHDILYQLNSKSVYQIVFDHCPKLQVPPLIRTFSHLGGLNFYNVTIDQWPASASLNHDSHPNLNYVSVFRSNLSSSAVPDGLMDMNFPHGITMVYFYQTNLAILPDGVKESWKRVPRLGFEFCRFDRFPLVLSSLQLSYVIMTSNPLNTTDVGIYSSSTILSTLWFSNSKLMSLPNDTMGSLEQLTELMLEYTHLTTVPEYLRKWYLNKSKHASVRHSLFGSPYCNATLSGDDEEERWYQEQVCAKNYGSAGGRFNIEMIAQQRMP